MKMIYRPGINKLIVSALRPFSGLLPASLKIPVNGQFSFHLHNGKKLHLEANPTNFLAKEIFWNGVESYEYELVRLFSEFASKSKSFFDIGANIGYFSLVAHAFNPNLKITCFEPIPSIFRCLSHNLELNHIEALVRNVALSDKTGTAEFYSVVRENFEDLEDQLNGEGTMNLDLVKDRKLRKFTVNTLTLDDYLKNNPENKPDLIKMDTEATEHLILRGASDFLSVNKPVIFCEVLPGMHEEDIAGELNRHGYVFFRIGKNHLVQTESLVHHIAKERDYVFIHRNDTSIISKIREIR